MTKARYLVALLDPPSSLKFKCPCKDGKEIVEAVRHLCKTIKWNPEEHYENFYEQLADTTRFDDGEVAFIDLWESNLLASMVIGRPNKVIQTAAEFGKICEES